MTDTSKLIMDRLVHEARQLKRGDVRLATLGRLKDACDAIADGSAAEVLRRSLSKGAHAYRAGSAPINPSTIAAYVKARQALGHSDWVGPTRVTIAADKSGMMAYVVARQAERGIVALPKKTSRQKSIDEIIDRLDAVEDQQFLRFAFEELRQAASKYRILIRGLASIPGIDVQSILHGIPATPALSAPTADPKVQATLRRLTQRLLDDQALAEYDLTFDGRRVRQRSGMRKQLVQADEIDALRRLTGEGVDTEPKAPPLKADCVES